MVSKTTYIYISFALAVFSLTWSLLLLPYKLSFYSSLLESSKPSQPLSVEITKVEEKQVGEYYTIKGSVKNTGSQPIEVWVRVDFINEKGAVIDSTKVPVIPFDLQPGGEGSFIAVTKNNATTSRVSIAEVYMR